MLGNSLGQYLVQMLARWGSSANRSLYPLDKAAMCGTLQVSEVMQEETSEMSLILSRRAHCGQNTTALAKSGYKYSTTAYQLQQGKTW
jgi:hypothetical protein